jgi:outer membrane protein OmpA-like peptidoglycan-associated protein
MSKWFLLIIPVLLSGFVQASTDRIYMSPMEQSKWVMTQDSALLCQIEHDIPRFGKAIFYQHSGRPLKLRVETLNTYKKNINIAFRSVTANWKGIYTETEISSLKSIGQHELVHVNEDAARHAYFELQQGFQPSLFFTDDQDGFNSTAVIMSTVNFRDIEPDFGLCMSNLLPYNFEDIKSARVHFEFDDEFPKVEEEERALSKILNYIKLDKSVHTLLISGHADFKGSECYNETLSARRAWYVYDYLVQSGVDPRLLEVKFFGETKPFKKGRDDASRAKNRRVTVTMIK